MPDDIKEVPQGMEKSGEENKTTKKLKPKHALFVHHYIDTHNASEACRLAGYKDKEPARTANNLMKRPEIIQEISRREAELHKALVKDKPQFLLDLQDLKRRAKEKNRLDTELKAMILEADILGLTKEEEKGNNTALFVFNEAKKFLEGSAMPKAEFVDSSPISVQISGNSEAPTQASVECGENKEPIASDTVSTLSGEVITIEPEIRGEG